MRTSMRPGRHLGAGRGADLDHGAGDGRFDAVFHLHGLDGEHELALAHALPDLHRQLDQCAVHAAGDQAVAFGVVHLRRSLAAVDEGRAGAADIEPTVVALQPAQRRVVRAIDDQLHRWPSSLWISTAKRCSPTLTCTGSPRR